MTKEKKIEILMADRCSKAEAERLINNGCVIFNSIEEYRNSRIENDLDPETAEDLRAGKVADHSVVNYDGHEYVIEYVL